MIDPKNRKILHVCRENNISEQQIQVDNNAYGNLSSGQQTVKWTSGQQTVK